VDPDNRRPVDYELRRQLLAELPRLSAKEVLRRSDEGLPKLWTVHHALRLRHEMLQAFGENGSYKSLQVNGSRADHVIGYMRGDSVAVIAPRLVLKLNNDWADTSVRLPGTRWHNRLTGQTFSCGHIGVKELFQDFPVALLVEH
jgi:(1->4)-alpha-D-glucan 1-alpha-D-glucosylmutase